MIDGHGDDSYKFGQVITSDFSSNICHQVDLSGLRAHLCGCMEAISSYPEPEPYTLEGRLAGVQGLPPASVCVTNGATEAIYLIAQAFRGANTAVLQPTFSEYADACRMHGHRVSSLYRLPAAEEGYRLPPDVQMLWLCNPNNPTGTVVEKRILKELITCNPQVCFVIDQSYEFFTMQPLFSSREAAGFPNVLLLHSMTKRYAIPGLRLGYITASAALLGRVRTYRMPWSVNRLAIEAGIYLLGQGVHGSSDASACLQEAFRLRCALKALDGLEVGETETHFMLVRLCSGKASALKDYLVRKWGILIRDASNFEGLDERFFRIATQTPEENDRLVQAVGQWLAVLHESLENRN